MHLVGEDGGTPAFQDLSSKLHFPNKKAGTFSIWGLRGYNEIYSSLNSESDFYFMDLVNNSMGRNYGIELTLEKRIKKGRYFLSTVPLYESKYIPPYGNE